jgi:hypothetical protein
MQLCHFYSFKDHKLPKLLQLKWGVLFSLYLLQAASSMELSMLWNTSSGLIQIKEAVICNIDWLIFIVISILPDILWEEGVSVSWSGTTKIIIIIYYYYII